MQVAVIPYRRHQFGDVTQMLLARVLQHLPVLVYPLLVDLKVQLHRASGEFFDLIVSDIVEDWQIQALIHRHAVGRRKLKAYIHQLHPLPIESIEQGLER
jgi:hypothetical protein